MIAVGAEWRRTRGADPFRAALVAALLFLEALGQRLHQLVPAKLLDLRLFFFGEIFLGEFAEPLFRDLRRAGIVRHQIEALEDMAEHAVEFVEVALVFHECCARQEIEILDTPVGEIGVGVECLHQREIFTHGDGQARGFQLVEEVDEHCRLNLPRHGRACPGHPRLDSGAA
jgi:hypothetical protein